MKQATQKRLPISVCMISEAEASRIGRTLESVAGFASEIIVVLNAEVADGTDRIATEHGAQVFREPWKGFIAQKNSAADKATQQWLLNLDADEVVSAELQDEVFSLFTRLPEACAAYSFPRLSFYLGRWIRHGDWYPDHCVRLWQNGKARWAGINPHAALKVDGTVRKLKHHLLHYTNETLNNQVIKTANYADDFVHHCAENGRHITFGDLVARPAWRFVRAYFLKLGFLDGWQGYTIAWLTAFYTFLRYAKAREAQTQASSKTEDRR